MTASIAFTDGTGAVTLTNSKPAPGDRFANWTGNADIIGPFPRELGSGVGHRFSFRSDYTASFDLAHIPASSLADVMRLILHLKAGNTCTITTNDHASNVYTTVGLAPDGDAKVALDEAGMYEYRLSLSVISLESPPVPLLCRY